MRDTSPITLKQALGIWILQWQIQRDALENMSGCMLKPPDCLRRIGLVGVASRIIRGPAIQKRFQRAYRDRQDFKKLCSAAHAYSRVSVSFAGQTLQSAYSATLRVFPP